MSNLGITLRTKLQPFCIHTLLVHKQYQTSQSQTNVHVHIGWGYTKPVGEGSQQYIKLELSPLP